MRRLGYDGISQRAAFHVAPGERDCFRRVFCRRDALRVGNWRIVHRRDRDRHGCGRGICGAVIDAEGKAVRAVVIRRWCVGHIRCRTRQRAMCGLRHDSIGQRIPIRICAGQGDRLGGVFGRCNALGAGRWWRVTAAATSGQHVNHHGRSHRSTCCTGGLILGGQADVVSAGGGWHALYSPSRGTACAKEAETGRQSTGQPVMRLVGRGDETNLSGAQRHTVGDRLVQRGGDYG